MTKTDYYEKVLGRFKASLRLIHEESSATVRLSDAADFGWAAKLTASLGERASTALGGTVLLDPGSDSHEVLIGAFIGRLRLYVGARSRGLKTILKALGVERRLTGLQIYKLADDGAPEGPNTVLRGHLWCREEGCFGGSNDFYVDVTSALFGKPERGAEKVIDAREVTVALPEGTYSMQARVVEIETARPRWPFRRSFRFVRFDQAPMLVPSKGGDTHHYGTNVGVEGTTIEEGIGCLVSRVLERRRRYGGRYWDNGPPPVQHEPRRETHRVRLISLDRDGPPVGPGPRYEGLSFKYAADLFHRHDGRATLTIGGPGCDIETTASHAIQGVIYRESQSGGLLLSHLNRPGSAIHVHRDEGYTVVGGDGTLLYPGDTVSVTSEEAPQKNARDLSPAEFAAAKKAMAPTCFKVYFHPIGPLGVPSMGIDKATVYSVRREGSAAQHFVGDVTTEGIVAELTAQLRDAPPDVAPSDEIEGQAAREAIASREPEPGDDLLDAPKLSPEDVVGLKLSPLAEVAAVVPPDPLRPVTHVLGLRQTKERPVPKATTLEVGVDANRPTSKGGAP